MLSDHDITNNILPEKLSSKKKMESKNAVRNIDLHALCLAMQHFSADIVSGQMHFLPDIVIFYQTLSGVRRLFCGLAVHQGILQLQFKISNPQNHSKSTISEKYLVFINFITMMKAVNRIYMELLLKCKKMLVFSTEILLPFISLN